MPAVHVDESRHAGDMSDDSLEPIIALLIRHRKVSAEFFAIITEVHTVLAQVVRAC